MRFSYHPAILLVAWLVYASSASAQSTGPTVTPSTLSFSYTVNSTTLPAAAAVKVTVPAALASLPLVVTPPYNWAAVTPLGGASPLTLTITVNPTGLSPGSYTASITVDTNPTSTRPASITVNLTVLNAPAELSVKSPEYAGVGSFVMAFSYTTGQGNSIVPAVAPADATCPANAMEVDVSSTGGIIPFTVTAANVKSTGTSGSSGTTPVWLRLYSPNQLPTTTTSGVANTGSYSPYCVTADLTTVQTLNPQLYTGQITITPTSSANGSATVIQVNLTVSAGPPILNNPANCPVLDVNNVSCNSGSPLFPNCIVANPIVNPVFTLYGDNFFNSSVVSLMPGASTTPISGVTTTLLSRQVLQATVPLAYFTPSYEGTGYPVQWTVQVSNPQTPSNPTPQTAQVCNGLLVLDPTQPIISQVVNAASYLTTSDFTGTPTSNNPNPAGDPTVAPREIISIFGANFGPTGVNTASPSACAGETGVQCYPLVLTASSTTTSWQVSVTFIVSVGGLMSAQYPAPILMYSGNQINAIVPYELSSALGAANTSVTIQVSVAATTAGTTTNSNSAPYAVTVMKEDPGVFTLASAGQGQAAVLNQDYSINGAKNAAARGSTIQIFATGMGELNGLSAISNPALIPPLALDLDGTVAALATSLADNTVVVEVGGETSVVSYFGTSEGSIDGLVQINAVVPPNAMTGASVPITVTIGGTAASHTTQSGATISVK